MRYLSGYEMMNQCTFGKFILIPCNVEKLESCASVRIVRRNKRFYLKLAALRYTDTEWNELEAYDSVTDSGIACARFGPKAIITRDG